MKYKKENKKFKMNSKQNISISIFMIFLIIALPFYSSNALASTLYSSGSIASILVTGQDHIHQVTKLGEPGMFFEIEIRSTSSVTPSQVLVNGVSADNCVAANTTICTLDLPNQAEGRQFYEVRYGSQTQSLAVVTDGTKPELQSFSLNRLSDGRIQASFNAVDSAQNTNLCAGLGKIEISDNEQFSNIVATQNYVPDDLSDCIFQDTLTFAGPTNSGNYTYYARAIDRASQVSNTVQRTFGVDVEIPIISEPKITKNGQVVTAFGLGTRDYVLQTEISENNLLSSASADLTAFGQNSSQNGICTREGLTYVCSWDLSMTIDNSTTSFAGRITAQDDSSNIVNRDFSIPITIDNDAPVITSLHTNHGSYIGTGNTSIIVEVDDAGGINEEAVRADLRSISNGYSGTEYADECVSGKCYWNNIISTATDGNASVSVYVEDLYGQSATKTEILLIDKVSPIIISSHHTPNSPAYPATVELTVLANDNSGGSGLSTIIGDISNVSTDGDLVTNTCEESECKISFTNLPHNATLSNLPFSISDSAGNTVNGSYQLQIYQSLASYTGQNVTVRIGEMSPKLIDRKVASKVPLRVYVPITYNKPDSVVVSDRLVQCNGAADFLDNSIEQNPYFIGESLDSSLLVFVLGLDDVTVRTDLIKFNCTISMYVRQGSIVYTNPVIDNFELKFELYNQLGGSLDDAVVDKLKDIQDKVDNGWNKFIGDASKIFEILKNVCNLIQTVQQVYSFVENMKPIVYAATRLIPGGDGMWSAYLKMECVVKSIKDWMWPTDGYSFRFLENADGTVGERIGVLSALTGGELKNGGEAPKIGGWVRRICAFVLCNQCSQGFNLIDDVIVKDVGADGGGQGFDNFFKDPIETMFPGVDIFPSGAPRREPGETDSGYETRRRNAAQGSLDYFANINLEGHYNPEDSFIVAAACLCIPGLIANAEKYRQLQCINAKCISDSAKAGISIAQCDIAHDQRTCLFFTGAIVNALPTVILKNIVNVITGIIRDLPGRLLVAAQNAGCGGFFEQVTKQVPGGTLGNTIKQCTTDAANTYLTAGFLTDPSIFICGALDATMLVWSWDSYIENAFNFDSWDKLFGDDKEVDYCEGAFDVLEGEDDSGDSEDPLTSVPNGAGVV